jgi:hypothetical protein
MKNARKQMPANAKRKAAKTGRRLQFEPLESRAVLSAIALGPAPLDVVPSLDYAPLVWPERAPVADAATYRLQHAASAADRNQVSGLSDAMRGAPSLSLERNLMREDDTVGLNLASVRDVIVRPGAPFIAIAGLLPGQRNAVPFETVTMQTLSMGNGGLAVTTMFSDVWSAPAPLAMGQYTITLDLSIVAPAPVVAAPEIIRMPLQVDAVDAGSALTVHDHAPPVDYHFAATAHLAPARPMPAPRAADALRNFAPLTDARPGTAEGDRSASALRTASAIAVEETPTGEGGPISLAYQASRSSDGSAGLANSLRTNRSSAQEGGYVDLGGLSDIPLGQLGDGEAARGNADEASATGPLGISGQDGDWTQDGPPAVVDKTQRSDQSPPRLAESTDAGAERQQTLNAEEGGAVELVAISADDSTWLPSEGSAERIAEVKKIPLDNGSAMFHAFDLATEPIQPDSSSLPVTGAGDDSVTSPTATAVPVSVDSPAHEKPGAADPVRDGQASLQPAGISSVIVASLLTIATRVHTHEPLTNRRRIPL